MMKRLNTAFAIVARSTLALPAATASRTRGLAVALLLSGLLVLSPVSAYAAGLDCPETGAGAVPDLLAGSQQIERMTTGNEVDLANEIKGLINRVQTEKPGISSDEIVNVLIAAYCPVVARMQASPADKWRLMRQFDAVGVARTHRRDDARRIADHRRRAAAAERIPQLDQSGGRRRPDPGAVHGHHPHGRGETIAPKAVPLPAVAISPNFLLAKPISV